MASITEYIKTGSFSGTATGSRMAGAWCRPVHRSTCCIAVHTGGSCCMCVPTTATCFIIEMWGQGGGGGGGCCCGVGSYGGQGGAYAWVACTTSGTLHSFCACSCVCNCSTCTICSGTPGQFSRVCRCDAIGGFWCVCGGAEGIWCCNPSYPSCFSGSTQNPSGDLINKYNTWWYMKTCSAALTLPAPVGAATVSGLKLANCSTTTVQTGITPTAPTFEGCASTVLAGGGAAPGAASGWDNISGCLCTCSCFSSPYVWLGACGWSDGGATKSPFGCYNAQNGITNAQCGGGMSVGGAAYAGGDQAWLKCTFSCGSCWVQCGNFPGGGGMSTWSQTAWANPGWGAPGLILMSWS